MTDKKNSICGCGCLPESEKGAKTLKPKVKKSEKDKG